MKYAFTALLLVAVGARAPAEDRVVRCAEVDKPMIEAQFARFNNALATKNPDTVTALFSKRAVLLPTLSGEARTTPAAIRDYFVYFLRQSPVGHIDTSNIRLGCNKATRMGNWTFTLTEAAGKKSQAHARYTFIYAYRHGEWMISHLHSSVMPAGH